MYVQVVRLQTVITSSGFIPTKITLSGTCPSCRSSISLDDNPLAAGIVPVASLDRYPSSGPRPEQDPLASPLRPLSLDSLTSYYIDERLMDELVRVYTTKFSTRAVVIYLNDLLRRFARPCYFDGTISSDEFRRNLTAVLVALALELLRIDDGPALWAEAARILQDVAPEVTTNQAPFVACLACSTLGWYSIMEAKLDRILNEECDALPLRQAVNDLTRRPAPDLFAGTDCDLADTTARLQVLLIASIKHADAKHVNQSIGAPALLRLRSAREGVHHTSQANVDMTAKTSLFAMQRRDLRPLPSAVAEKSRSAPLLPVAVMNPLSYDHVSPLMLREEDVLKAALDARSNPPSKRAADGESCENNFRANESSASSSSRRAVEGLMTCVCSHLICHLAFNINTGEQHAYALLAIRHMLGRGRIAVISYDIACKLSTKFTALIDELAADPNLSVHVSPTSPYIIVGPLHINCHVARCQHRFGYIYMTGIGRPCGEMVESFNSYLNSVKSGSKYMGGTNYLITTDLKIQVNNSDQRSKIGSRLVSHMKLARRDWQHGENELRNIQTELQESHDPQRSGDEVQAALRELNVLGGLLHEAMARGPQARGVNTAVVNDFAPPLFVQAVWLRLQKMGFELPFLQYEPTDRWDERELEGKLGGFFMDEQMRGQAWTMEWRFVGQRRVIGEVGDVLRDNLLPFLSCYFEAVFFQDLAKPLAEYVHMTQVLAKEDEGNGDKAAAIQKAVDTAAAGARKALETAKKNIEKARKLMDFFEGQVESRAIQEIVRSVAFKDLRRQLDGAKEWDLSKDGHMFSETADLLATMFTSANGKPTLSSAPSRVRDFVVTARIQLRVHK